MRNTALANRPEQTSQKSGLQTDALRRVAKTAPVRKQASQSDERGITFTGQPRENRSSTV